MNTELINKVADFLEAHPDAHEQTMWMERYFDDDVRSRPLYIEWEDEYASEMQVPQTVDYELGCGTVGCVAGWGWTFLPQTERDALLREHPTHSWAEAGALAFDIPSSIADRLFHGDYLNGNTDEMIAALRYLAEHGDLPDQDPTWDESTGDEVNDEMIAALRYLAEHGDLPDQDPTWDESTGDEVNER